MKQDKIKFYAEELLYTISAIDFFLMDKHTTWEEKRIEALKNMKEKLHKLYYDESIINGYEHIKDDLDEILKEDT